MSSAILKISRPTKLELLRLRKRLSLSRRYYNMLKDRVTYLIKVYRDDLRELIQTRKKLHRLVGKAIETYYKSMSVNGVRQLEYLAPLASPGLSLRATYRNVGGIWVPSVSIEERIRPTPILPLDLAELQKLREEIIVTMIRVGELEKELALLSKEIGRLRKIVNTLEKIYIPRLEKTVRYLSMKFDELSREETVRLLRVKRLVIERRAE